MFSRESLRLHAIFKILKIILAFSKEQIKSAQTYLALFSIILHMSGILFGEIFLIKVIAFCSNVGLVGIKVPKLTYDLWYFSSQQMHKTQANKREQ